MNVRKKLFLINSIIIVLLATLTILTSIIASQNIIKSDAKTNISLVVSKNAKILINSNGIVTDEFQFVENGVYLSIYAIDGTLISGISPESYGESLDIEKGVMQSVKYNGQSFYVYDFEIVLPGRDNVYLRGMSAGGESRFNVYIIVIITSTLLFTAFAVATSLMVIKKAVKPIEKMTDSVNGIVSSTDLSLRIDVSEQDEDVRSLQIAYNLMLERLERLFNNQQRFTSDVSHELRTPLTVILNESEFALMDLNTVEEKNNSLETINRQTKKLVKMVEQLLEFSRFCNVVQVPLTRENISILTQDCCLVANDKNIVISLDIEENVYANIDVTLYSRLVQNLIDNSIKYGKDNGNVWVSLKSVNGKAELRIKDDGIGMSETTKKQAYERFYQEDSSRHEKGLGLGLSFVKEIVRLFGGNIQLISSLGVGTEFIITFM